MDERGILEDIKEYGSSIALKNIPETHPVTSQASLSFPSKYLPPSPVASIISKNNPFIL